VRKSARVRLPDGRRVYATQVYWEHVFGLSARKIDAHMRRACGMRPGFVCMNPAHISHKETGEAATAMIARLWAQRDRGAAATKKSAPAKKTAVDVEATLWENRPDATEEMVIDAADVPDAIEAELPAWRVMDYFWLQPEVQFEPRAGDEGAVES
jgi:hypothetical protein